MHIIIHKQNFTIAVFTIILFLFSNQANAQDKLDFSINSLNNGKINLGVINKKGVVLINF